MSEEWETLDYAQRKGLELAARVHDMEHQCKEDAERTLAVLKEHFDFDGVRRYQGNEKWGRLAALIACWEKVKG